MVVDRASSAVMLAILGKFYPNLGLLFYGDIVLDMVSHWYQMYASLYCGDHHKHSKTEWKLLEIYYSNYYVLSALCYGNTMFLSSCYLLHFA